MATKQPKPDVQVLIVGGGPVGLGLAVELGQRDISVAVVERYETLHHVPKGQNLTQRSGEHFRLWGVSDDIRAAAPIPHEYGSAGLTAYGALLGGYTYDWYRRAEVRPYYFADNERLPQYETEAVLRKRVAELDCVKVHYGWSAIDLNLSDTGVQIEITAHKAGENRGLSAEYVVGCDGSGSVTRDLAGITQDIEAHGRRMVLLVFKSNELHQILEQFPGKSYYYVINPELNGYWQFLGRVDLSGTWFFHAPVPAGTTGENFDFSKYLHAIIGAEFDLEFEHIGFWDLRTATAKTYRNGRAFIAGDAAHSHPPYGGFGVNTGLEDVRNLGWKLAATLQGWGGDALLDSYTEERLPVFRSTAKDFIARMIEDDRIFIEQYDPNINLAAFEQAWSERSDGGNSDIRAYAPHYQGSPIVVGDNPGPPSAVGTHSFEAIAGNHLPPQETPDGVELFASLGSGFTLISMDWDEAFTQAMTDAAANLGVPLTIIKQPAGVQNSYNARHILVRPDHYIAWAGDGNVVEAGEIIRRAIGENPD